jgi:spore maturation protein SpmB
MLTVATLTRGLKKGLSITWELSKVIVPVYFIITIFKYTPVMEWIARIMEPVMHMVGLPGEASLPLVLGMFLNIYAAIGAILPLGMNTTEITIIAAMLLMAHSLPMETAISKKSGAKVASLVLVRIIMAFLVGAGFNIIL